MDSTTDAFKASKSGVILAAGASAGLSVDVILFPLDTIKTRMQSAPGFYKAGGFHKMYSGLGPVVIGSSPGAAVFFYTYELTKSITQPLISDEMQSVRHMFSACCGEIASCVIRVPVEVIKQRSQANSQISAWKIFQNTLNSEGILGMYRGYFATVFREIPFSLIQFPIWEHLKKKWSKKQKKSVSPWQSALCGGVAGGLAAALTTPIDVIKTRIMLSQKQDMIEYSMKNIIADIWYKSKFKGFFAGITPRVLWISTGGIIFFGAYEKVKNILITCFSL